MVSEEALGYLENVIDTLLEENKNKIEFNKANNYDCELLEERKKDLEGYKQALLEAQEQEKENATYRQLGGRLGCPLCVLLKARKNKRIFLNRANKYVKIIDISIYDEPYIKYLDDLYASSVLLKEYKKSWWLKKDKTE